MFAGITLALGCVLGFFIVCIIDRVFPTGPQPAKQDRKGGKKDQNKKNKKVTKSSLKLMSGNNAKPVVNSDIFTCHCWQAGSTLCRF